MTNDFAVEGQRQFPGTLSASSRSERRCIYVVRDAEGSFCPLKTYVRADRIAVTVPATQIQDRVVAEFVVARVQDETGSGVRLGNALLDSGDKAGAKREAERALVLAPGSTAARDLLRRSGG